MKIYVANSSEQKIGGGWSFIRNLKRGMGDLITDNYDEADIYFISSPTMVQRDEVQHAKQDGKKIVLRIDNAVRNSRNRNTGMTRMKDFAEWSDLVIYQSAWARDYLKGFLDKDGVVILNGIDTDLFKPAEKNENVIYTRFNRDETKNWEAARYWFSRNHKPDQKLLIAGNFSDELRNGNFDFYNDEAYEYIGVLDERSMAKVLSVTGKFLYTYFNDACSNSLIEALCSGCEIVGDEYYRTTGGAAEILRAYAYNRRDYFSIYRMAKEYTECLQAIV